MILLLKKTFFCFLLLITFSCSLENDFDETLADETLVIGSKSYTSTLLTISDVSAEFTKEGYLVTNVLDGNSSTRWGAKGSSVDFFIDLDTQSLIDYLKIAFPSGSSRVYDYEVYTSLNKVIWYKVKDSSSSGLTNELEEIDLPNSSAKHIKIVLKGSNVNTWNYISQIEVYGSEEINDVETVIPSIIDFGDLVVETSWISKDKYDRSTFLASEIVEEEWMAVYDSGVVMMKCLEEDGQRTELKEDNGFEAPLTTYKSMNYIATLHNIPENGVTIAQVHNRGGVKRPWIRVYVDHDHYIKIKATATTPEEDKSTYEPVYVGPKYTEGDEFFISITTQEGKAFFEITTKDEVYKEVLQPSSDWDEFTNSYYLKAGVYTEGEDVEPVIEFSTFYLNY